MSERRSADAELDNLERALERGVISEREYDAELDAFIAEQNKRANERRALVGGAA